MDRQLEKHHTQWVTGVSNVTHDLMRLLTARLPEIAALEAYERDADEGDDALVRAFLDRLEQRAREDVVGLRALVAERL